MLLARLNEMAASLIGPDQTFVLLFALMGTILVAQRCERTVLGGVLSVPGIVILLGMLLGNFRVLPKEAPLYDTIWSVAVPAAIPLLLLRADLRLILRLSRPVVIAFVIGSAGTILGASIASRVLPLGEHGGQWAGVLASSWVGGSMNLAAVSQALGLAKSPELAAVVAADNVVGSFFLPVVLILSARPTLLRLFAARAAAQSTTQPQLASEHHSGAQPDAMDLVRALCASFGICAAGYFVETGTGSSSAGILSISVLSLLFATFAPRRWRTIPGDHQLGLFMLLLFFSIVAVGADFASLAHGGPAFFLLAAVILVVHLTLVLLCGWLCRVPLPELMVGSVAAALGAADVCAVAAARKWDALLAPGVLCAVLGYAAGNFVGIFLAHLLS